VGDGRAVPGHPLPVTSIWDDGAVEMIEDPWGRTADAPGPSMTMGGHPSAWGQAQAHESASRDLARLLHRLTGSEVVDPLLDMVELWAGAAALTEALGHRGPRRARLRALLHEVEPSTTTDLVRRILAALTDLARHLLALGRLAALTAEPGATIYRRDNADRGHGLSPPGHLVTTGPIAAHAPPCASISVPFIGEAIAA